MSAARKNSQSARADRARKWRPSGIVTLTTDFGLQDPYVAMMKGVVLSSSPAATIVDVTHAIAPQDVRSAAWILRHAFRYFPVGTVHVAVVDPGVGTARRLLVAHDHGHAFLAPDNGLLAPLLSASASVHELDVENVALAGASCTFHGRDILAPAAAQLARGSAPEAIARARLARWEELDLPRPTVRDGREARGVIVLADRYGNLISNLTPADLGGDLSRWRVECGARRIRIRRAYAEARPGELLALVDSYGALEVAVRDGDASRLLRAGPGSAITARRLR
jgi:S-adenosylmethionine hydrolase